MRLFLAVLLLIPCFVDAGFKFSFNLWGNKTDSEEKGLQATKKPTAANKSTAAKKPTAAKKQTPTKKPTAKKPTKKPSATPKPTKKPTEDLKLKQIDEKLATMEKNIKKIEINVEALRYFSMCFSSQAKIETCLQRGGLAF